MQAKKGKWEGPLLSETDPAESGDPARIRLRSADYPGWIFTVRFGSTGEMVGFAIDEYDWRANRREPLTATFVHGLPVGGIVARARAIAAGHARARAHRGVMRFGPSGLDGEPADLAAWSSLVTARPGRAGKPDAVFARVAAEYVRLVEAGERAPLRRIAETLGVSESRARNLVHDARKRGLLSGTRQGQRGGRLTAKARRLLDEEG